jgi:hypothetical protein
MSKDAWRLFLDAQRAFFLTAISMAMTNTAFSAS